MAFEFLSGRKKESASETVHDQEKAHQMAEVEDEYRNLAHNLDQYMKDPVAYRAQEDARVAAVADDGSFTSNDANDYMELYRAGVRPDNLKELGERMAEYHAKENDYEKDLKDKPSLALRLEIAWFKLQQRYLERAFTKAMNNVDFSKDEGKSFVVTHLLDQFQAGDENAGAAKQIHQWMSHGEHLQQLAEDELERRKNGSTDGLAA